VEGIEITRNRGRGMEDPTTSKRYLVVNADDFGRTAAINRGIVRAHAEGIVTSASLMVRWEAARDASAYARRHRNLGLGLHVDLGEWGLRAGQWERPAQGLPLDDAPAIEAEVDDQLARFRELTGEDPTHLDSHQHVHRREPVRGVLRQRARELGVPLRHYARGVRHCGAFYGQDPDGRSRPEQVSVDRLSGILDALEPGVTELACHPGERGDDAPGYACERPLELRTLCDPRARAVIRRLGIVLCSFRDAPLPIPKESG
jgi:predicted glycoside hydrolase/deacetylase ChbG (UPF0249 family)